MLFKSNFKIKILNNCNTPTPGSHAALTCHIAVMRHVITNVVSVGHFDNFCCWQFGDDSSAHKDGIDIMLEEIGKPRVLYLMLIPK